jgi:hypothetical protein
MYYYRSCLSALRRSRSCDLHLPKLPQLRLVHLHIRMIQATAPRVDLGSILQRINGAIEVCRRLLRQSASLVLMVRIHRIRMRSLLVAQVDLVQ